MDVTATFIQAAVLTWILPLALLIAILIWWIVALRRRSSDES